MFRTSVYFPKPLHYRLQIAAREAKVSVSNFLAELADRELERREKAQLDLMYFELKKLSGIGPKGITNASTTIDELLYGDGPHAAWRGNGTD